MNSHSLFKGKKLKLSAIGGLLLVLLISLTFPIQKERLAGKIVGVSDGDTVTLLTKNRQNVKIRLAQIDAPESNQPFGAASKKMLSDLIYKAKVTVRKEGVDHYGRTIGTIFLAETDINAAMVRQGGAWVYDQYVTDSTLYELQREAQDFKRGLWALPKSDHIPPWQWRGGRRVAK